MSGLIVITTVPNRAVARRLGKALLDRNWAAAMQVSGPIQSTYWWKGKIRRHAEYTCAFRTTTARYAAVEKLIRELHPYELPEIYGLKLDKSYPPYLRWIAKYSTGKRAK